jgi:hypothetical protein
MSRIPLVLSIVSFFHVVRLMFSGKAETCKGRFSKALTFAPVDAKILLIFELTIARWDNAPRIGF